MEAQLEVIGFLLVALALLHAPFARYFNWRQEFAAVSLINRQMMYVHTFFIAFTVLLMGVLCLTSAPELVSTVLGRKLALGCGLFWLARLLIQFFGYSAVLWQGKRFETTIHVVFSIFWAYLSTVFILVSFG
ncbi:hypothetical protein I2I05_09245 [Hymenobacter sp. BT683]|uniref:Uncharacterized protein n=1 Tax=Hymenobacter jeongseonensis TaxID=2791027 RepID=A0ABS0II35_9BACT|nr:hypothetical protein [Hymenobacter jeongseonensis]MBF9237578.1 hypothetical protein [Hymenobacter jeongseonensis]